MKRSLDQETKPLAANPVEMETEDTIRRRAYELYEERGRGDGHELQDWVDAEAEVLSSRDVVKAT